MMKAILVIDIDEDMFKTIDQERIKSGYAFVDVPHHYDEAWEDWVYHRVKLLSAQPMPRPKEFTPLNAYEHDKDIYVYGWNDCLREIEGETE